MCPEHPDDAILLTKQYIHSSQLTQQPILVFPQCMVDGVISRRSLSVIPRNQMQERAKKEYLKAAAGFEAEPWGLSTYRFSQLLEAPLFVRLPRSWNNMSTKLRGCLVVLAI